MSQSVRDGDGVEQIPGVLLLGVIPNLFGWPCLDDYAFVHHDDAGGDESDNGEVMTDEQE